MKKTSQNGRIIIIIFLAVFLCLVFSSVLPAKERDNLNVVLIVIDALRADHLGCYGYARDTSPNIDRFASQGILFTKAFSQGACTRISIPSLFTSLFPDVLRIPIGGIELPEKLITLPEILEKNGYNTASFLPSGFSVLPERFKFNNVISYEKGVNQIAPRINQQVAAWLKENSAKPFFVYLHYLGAHYPYLPPEPFDAMFLHDAYPEMEEFAEDKIAILKPPREWEKDMRDFIVSQYDGRIRYVDGYIGEFLDKLNELKLTENTLVIITADHGEGFLDHGSFSHSNNLYDELIHVPVIMRLPPVLPAGEVFSGLVRLVDIMPTVFGILNIASDSVMQGASLLSPDGKLKAAGLESFSQAHILAHEGWLKKGVRTERWSLIGTYDNNGDEVSLEFYDLEKDPEQKDNLAGQKAPEFQMLKRRLRDYIASCRKLRDFLLGEGHIDKPVLFNEEEEEALRNLGYMR